MKRLVFLLFALCLFVSCEGPMGPEGPAGAGSNWKVINVIVKENAWEPYADNGTGLNAFYTAAVDVPELTSFIYKNGNVQAYMYYIDPITGDEVQTPLFYGIPIQSNPNDTWTEFYSFDFMVGSVAFYLRYNDLAAIPPAAREFRIVLTW
ncbi:hypothetical protein [Parabacteroides sp. Marseille-P3160]|uniref:hypothetical protein n=1 Tax=Parabacteroides sp. Marseille-P3160 TaxID=1917887 RepID=UPI001118C49C|nr:hypothetical protein [Parabacteroides sp. Marseille-P3160]